MREWTHGREDHQYGLHCFGGCSSKLISRAVAQRVDKNGKDSRQHRFQVQRLGEVGEWSWSYRLQRKTWRSGEGRGQGMGSFWKKGLICRQAGDTDRCHNGLVTGDFRERLGESQFLSWEEKADAGSRTCRSPLLTLETETGAEACFLGAHSKGEDQKRAGIAERSHSSRLGPCPISLPWAVVLVSLCFTLSLSTEGGWQAINRDEQMILSDSGCKWQAGTSYNSCCGIRGIFP